MANSLLFNPHTYDPAHLDAETRRLLRATTDFFENRGKKALIDGCIDRAWYGDFLDFAAKEGLFATFLTPAADGGDDPAERWDTARNAALSEILGFYGLGYWYTEQMAIRLSPQQPAWRSAVPLPVAHLVALLPAPELGAAEETTTGVDTFPPPGRD
jgi:acyl-CoA dehydrogenase